MDRANRRRLHISSTRRLARPTPTRREEGRETSTEDARARREVCLPLGEISPQKAPRGTKRRVAHDCCSRVSLPCRFHQVVGWFARIKISRNGRSERRRDAGVATARRSARARPRTRAVSRGGGLASLSKHVRAVVLAVRGGGVFRDSPATGSRRWRCAATSAVVRVGSLGEAVQRRGGVRPRRSNRRNPRQRPFRARPVPKHRRGRWRGARVLRPHRQGHPRLRRARPGPRRPREDHGPSRRHRGHAPPVPRRHRHQPPHRRRGHDRGQTPRPRRAPAAPRGVGRVEDRPRRRGGASRGCHSRATCQPQPRAFRRRAPRLRHLPRRAGPHHHLQTQTLRPPPRRRPARPLRRSRRASRATFPSPRRARARAVGLARPRRRPRRRRRQGGRTRTRRRRARNGGGVRKHTRRRRAHVNHETHHRGMVHARARIESRVGARRSIRAVLDAVVVVVAVFLLLPPPPPTLAVPLWIPSRLFARSFPRL